MNSRTSSHEILYYLGGTIVFLGIVILLAQHWNSLPYSTKLLTTLGTGISSYIIGVLLTTTRAGNAFYLISILTLPAGLAVLLDHAGLQISAYSMQSWISGCVFCIYLLSYFIFRSNLFMLSSILFGTWFFFSFTNLLLIQTLSFNNENFPTYRTLAIGCSYILFGYAFDKGKHQPLTGFLYGAGIIGFLGSLLSLCTWWGHKGWFWEILFPLFSFISIFLSVPLKSKALLIFGLLFIIFDIFRLSSNYFSQYLGWPLALVVAGLAVMGAGYLAIRMNRK